MNTDLIMIALGEYGLKETPGAADNPQILEMAKEAGFTDYTHDDLAWCSMFASWVAMKAGCERSTKLNARSWLTIGTPVSNPEMGDVVVLWRNDPAGTLGHVGFFINKDDHGEWILAGNQGDMVDITPFHETRVLAYRRLGKVTI